MFIGVGTIVVGVKVGLLFLLPSLMLVIIRIHINVSNVVSIYVIISTLLFFLAGIVYLIT